MTGNSPLLQQPIASRKCARSNLGGCMEAHFCHVVQIFVYAVSHHFNQGSTINWLHNFVFCQAHQVGDDMLKRRRARQQMCMSMGIEKKFPGEAYNILQEAIHWSRPMHYTLPVSKSDSTEDDFRNGRRMSPHQCRVIGMRSLPSSKLHWSRPMDF